MGREKRKERGRRQDVESASRRWPEYRYAWRSAIFIRNEYNSFFFSYKKKQKKKLYSFWLEEVQRRKKEAIGKKERKPGRGQWNIGIHYNIAKEKPPLCEKRSGGPRFRGKTDEDEEAELCFRLYTRFMVNSCVTRPRETSSERVGACIKFCRAKTELIKRPVRALDDATPLPPSIERTVFLPDSQWWMYVCRYIYILYPKSLRFFSPHFRREVNNCKHEK